MNIVAQVFVGVDVSKRHLDVHIVPLEKAFRVENTEKGIARLMKEIKPHSVEQIVCESTGGYEYAMLRALHTAGYKTWQVEPNRIKSFARSEGKRAKNDKIDARMIALFAAQKQKPHSVLGDPYSEQQKQLHDYVARKSDLTKILVAEKLRLGNPQPNVCKGSIEEHITFLQKQITDIAGTIKALLEKDQVFAQKARLLESVPGVAGTTAAALLVYVPELGSLNGKQAAALVGIAPYVNQSGSFYGKASISGGRAEPRSALYMAAMAGVVHNPVLRSFFQRLKAAGKRPKVALIAVMRKLLTILNAMLKTGEMWRPARVG